MSSSHYPNTVSAQTAAANVAALGGLTRPAPAPCNPQMQEELDLLQIAASELESQAAYLIQRLQPVSRDDPTGAGTDQALDTYRVPMAEDIRNQRRRIQEVTDRLRTAVGLLEI